ncbi:MAG TPA: apolipoprotein N-acyltransferase [Gammaproteobacteria bacterium]|nr:apolipoprotein N-acyltransferase [bacterium BMS3Abin11]GMT40658.1 MAG: apolipoprotein N-acyltransferase [bacterium]HDH15354.1 apolipoprotein N-acyltransferase [Gammaproteobacteria bacterium]
MIKPRWQGAIVFAAGAGLVLSFAPFKLFPLAILFPAILFYFWSAATPLRSAWLGFLFGLGLFGVGASWVYVSIHEFGFMPAPLAVVLVFLFVAFLSLFPAIAGWLQARLLHPSCYRLIFAAPIFWVLAEWFRGWLMTGFPWLNLGYSQSNSVLMNFAPLVGVYGMSLAVAILSALLVAVIRYKGKYRFLASALFITIFIAGWLSGKLEFVKVSGAEVDIALLQGNVPLKEKWQAGATKKIIARYVDLSRSVVNESAVIVWPEGAVPESWQRALPVLEDSLPRRLDGSLPDYLIGTIDIPANDEYYNAAIIISDKVKSPGPDGIYRKQHLVPFGEFLPFKPLFGWVVKYLEIPMSDFSSWHGAQPDMVLAGWPVAVSICYEDAFGEELAPTAGDAAFLINISEDAWFGDSLASHQRLQMAQIRARETGRYFVRAANTGFTAVINEKGEITSILEQFVPAVLQAKVLPMTGLTPYVRYGNKLFLLLLGLWLLPALYFRFWKKEG